MEVQPRIGHRILRARVVDSTNTVAAAAMARGEAPHGTVIIAREQTAGRGQRGRTWTSTPGADLTLSIVLEPPALRAERQFAMAKLAALAVHDVVRQAGADAVRVKWPNDVLVERRKVAGILIACDLLGERVRHAVVGVGLNVNSTDMPEDLAATSLKLATGRDHDLEAVLDGLTQAFEQRYRQWLQGGCDHDYAEGLWSAGRWADMLLDGAPCTLRPMDVDELGRLLVEHDDGRVAAYGLDRLRFAPR